MIIFKQGLRQGTTNKYKKDLSTKDFYKNYCNNSLNKKRIPIDYNIYYKIIRQFNLSLKDKIIKEASSFEMPYKLGYLGIMKYDVNFDIENKKNWKVNYGESRKQGMIIYYDQYFRFKWRWDKTKLKLTGKKFYKFTPCRDASRGIAKHVNENPGFDYYTVINRKNNDNKI